MISGTPPARKFGTCLTQANVRCIGHLKAELERELKMFDPRFPDMERALDGERRPHPLTPQIREALQVLRAGTTCTYCKRNQANVADRRGAVWCNSCFERRQQQRWATR